MPKMLTNVRVSVNAADIRKETRDGREVWVVPSKTMPRDIVMNGILYPGSEVEASYKTLESTPAPFGHPKVNGKFVSARTPAAINSSWIGAFNERVEYSGGRISVDKVVDIEVAKRTKEGRAVLAAIEKREPIQTSTGIFASIETLEAPLTNSAGQQYTRVAKGLLFDHDALLLNETPAATPEQGVGIFVNAEGKSEEVEAIELDAEAMDEIAESVARSVAWRAEEAEREKNMKSVIDKIKGAIKSILKGNLTAEPTTNGEETTMPVEQKEFDALKATVEGLAANAKNKPEWFDAAVAGAIKPLSDQVTTIVTNAKAAEDAERAQLVEKVVKANIFTEATAKELTTNALREAAAKIQPQQAQPMFAAFVPNAANSPNDAGSFMENLKAAGGDK